MSRLARLARTIERCRRCRLGYVRKNAVPGEGPTHARMFFVGEAPGREEDLSGRPFVGQAGRILTDTFRSVGLRREDVFITSVNKCRPPRNRKPRADEVAACRPYLAEQIDIVKPRVIIALGRHSLSALTTSNTRVSEARKEAPRYHGIPIVATYHPAAVLYNRPVGRQLRKDIARAASLTRKPGVRHGGLRPIPGRRWRKRVSSGGVPWDGGSRFLLIRRMDEGIWCVPKGGLDAGETLDEAALREIWEEAGLRGKILCPLASVRYKFYDDESDTNVDKTVHYFLVRVRSGQVRLERGFEDARWCTYREANALVHYANDRRVVEKAHDAVRGLV